MAAALAVATSLGTRTELSEAIGWPVCALLAGPTDYPRVNEIRWDASGQLGMTYGLARTNSLGSYRQTSPDFACVESGEATGGIILVRHWYTPPPTPTTFFRRWRALGNAKQSFVLMFPDGMQLIPGYALMIWQIGGVGPNFNITTFTFTLSN